jgi:hypothetical protein
MASRLSNGKDRTWGVNFRGRRRTNEIHAASAPALTQMKSAELAPRNPRASRASGPELSLQVRLWGPLNGGKELKRGWAFLQGTSTGKSESPDETFALTDEAHGVGRGAKRYDGQENGVPIGEKTL